MVYFLTVRKNWAENNKVAYFLKIFFISCRSPANAMQGHYISVCFIS